MFVCVLQLSQLSSEGHLRERVKAFYSNGDASAGQRTNSRCPTSRCPTSRCTNSIRANSRASAKLDSAEARKGCVPADYRPAHDKEYTILQSAASVAATGGTVVHARPLPLIPLGVQGDRG